MKVKANKSVFNRVISVLFVPFMILGMIILSPTASSEQNNGFVYVVEDGEITITGYSGPNNVVIPTEIDGYQVTKIGRLAFPESITSLVIPDSVKSIDSLPFIRSRSSLKSLWIGDGVEIIESGTFSSCKYLEDLHIGNGVKTIGGVAFCRCIALTEVTIPDNVEEIGVNAFYRCTSLRSVNIGKGVKTIRSGAFGETPLLNELTLDPDNNYFSNYGSILYDKELTTLIYFPCSGTIIDFPDTVTCIADGAMEGCRSLVRFEIPESVTSIGELGIYWCESLEEIIIPDNVTHVGGLAMAGNMALKSVRIGQGLTQISDYLFSGDSSLENLTIPDNVRSIGKEAFSDCTSLKTITIPAEVKEIGVDAFKGCGKLKDIYFGGTKSAWASISRDADVPNGAVVHYGGAPTIVDPPAVEFTDVDSGAFYADAVLWAVEKDITTGTSKTTFSPGAGCTRSQVVTFLWRAAGKPEPRSSANPFSDVKKSDYFYKAVLWAVENEITKGTSAKEFSPSDVCTRGQIVTFLWRAAGTPEPEGKDNPFDDVKSDNYYCKAVLWTVERGITKGTSGTKFSPADTCTRGQVVTFLFRNK